jgi:CHAT domain-containing protein
MPFLIPLVVTLTMNSAPAPGKGVAASFVRAIASNDWPTVARMGGADELPPRSWNSARDVLERFECIDVLSYAELPGARPGEIVVLLDAVGTSINGARQRRRLPREWHLIYRQGALIQVLTPPLVLVEALMTDPDAPATGSGLQVADSGLLRDAGRALGDLINCSGQASRCLAAGGRLAEEALRRSDPAAAAYAFGAIARVPDLDVSARRNAAASALARAEGSGDADALAYAYLSAAEAEEKSDRKELLYAKAAESVQALDDPRPALWALWQLAGSVYTRFDIPKAFLIYDQLETASRRVGWCRGETLGLYGKIRTNGAVSDYGATAEFAVRAASAAAELADRERQSKAMNLYAKALRLIDGNCENALTIYWRALANAPSDAFEAISYLHTGIGECLSVVNLEEAERHFDAALEAGRASNSNYLDATLGSAAQLRFARGHHAEGMALLREGIRAQRGELWVTWALRGSLGWQLLLCGDVDAAIEELMQALDVVELRRARSPTAEQRRARYFSEQIFIHEALVQALVAAHRYEEALGVAEKMRARVLADVLQSDPHSNVLSPADTAQLDVYNERIAALNQALLNAGPSAERHLRLELRQARVALDRFDSEMAMRYPSAAPRTGTGTGGWDISPLPDDTVAVEFVMAGEDVIALTMRGTNVEAVTLQISRHQLELRTARLTQMIANRDLGYAQEASALYRILIGPIEEQLKDAPRLLLIPDGLLWSMPFEVLRDARGRYLGDAHAIEYRPSLRSLRRFSNRPRHATQQLLALADPLLPAGYANLPEAALEARAISRIYGTKRGDVYIGAAASEAEFKKRAANYRVIHLATHTVTDSDGPMHSSILLSTNGHDGENGLLEAREITNLTLNADVVVLAACETAGNQVLRGEGFIGLSWAFLLAGSPTTVVSRWKTESRSTRKLMTEFHRRLVGGASAEVALRASQQMLRQDPRFADPLYWAAFVVIGAER